MITYSSKSSNTLHLKNYFRRCIRYTAFAWEWAKADLKSRNFDTYLGFFWLYLNPFLYGSIYFVFITILSGEPASLERLAFIICNLQLWGLFSSSITNAIGSVSVTNPLLILSSIPRVLFPLTQGLIAARVYLYSLIAYIPFHLFSGRPLRFLWLVPPLILVIVLLGTGIGLLLAFANLFVRDVSRLLPHVLRLGMYLSPVVWSYELALGEKYSAARLNPMYHIFKIWTQVVDSGISSVPMWLQEFGLVAISCTAVFIIGLIIFIRNEDILTSHG